LCCSSYENEQYKKAKQMLPRLGQRITTDQGEGIVVSLQVLKELITVRYADPYREETYSAAELLAPRRRAEPERDLTAVMADAQPPIAAAPADQSPSPPQGEEESRPRQRRRRRIHRPGGNDQSQSRREN
jgi:hypothetical protein